MLRILSNRGGSHPRNRNHKKARVKRAFEIGTTEWIPTFNYKPYII